GRSTCGTSHRARSSRRCMATAASSPARPSCRAAALPSPERLTEPCVCGRSARDSAGRTNMRAFAAFVALCLLLSAGFGAAPPAQVPADWLKLIDQLGEEDEQMRGAASKKLQALGEDVIGPLRVAAKSHDDVDVRLRAAVLADAIERKVYGVLRQLVGHE